MTRPGYIARRAYKVSEVAQMYGCDVQTVRSWIHTGKVRAVKLGGEWRITRAALDELDRDDDIRNRWFPESAGGAR